MTTAEINLETLTPNWHTLSLAVGVENSDVHVGGQVPPRKMRDKVCVPVDYPCYLGMSIAKMTTRDSSMWSSIEE